MLGIIPGVNPNGPPGTAGRPVQRGVNVITADNVNRILRFNGNTSAGRLAARHGAAGTEDRVVGLRSTGARETVAQTLAARMRAKHSALARLCVTVGRVVDIVGRQRHPLPDGLS